MGLIFDSSLQIGATLVSNEFIDIYMASANGEYVKVYLYLLRHQAEDMTLSTIADALEHTESDIRRALAYWEKLGLIRGKARGEDGAVPGGSRAMQPRAMQPRAMQPRAMQPRESKPTAANPIPSQGNAAQEGLAQPGKAQVKGGKSGLETGNAAQEPRQVYSPEQVARLGREEDFSQLLYIAQKYLKKVFTQKDSEVFAYLYDGLGLSLELLEYLVEYCAQNGHTSLRYVETVAINWHKLGLLTVEQAKAYADGFSKDTYGVMRAFGLTDRQPAGAEMEKIQSWYRTYGFTREIVLEACNRTMEAIHTPSFQYADKILSEWHKAGVRTLGDVEELDKRRSVRPVQAASGKKAQVKNQFHNFNQRDTDYDAMVLEQWKEQ